MTTAATYRAWIGLFRRIKLSGLVVVLLGALVGFAAHASARTVISIVSGLLATWLYVAGSVEQKRYELFLDRIDPDKSNSIVNGSLEMTKPESSPINGDTHNSSPEPSPSETTPLSDSERENRRLSALHRYERFFTRLAIVGVGIAVLGIAISFLFSDGVRAVIIAGFGVGGLWISAMSLVIRKRIRTGPKAQ